MKNSFYFCISQNYLKVKCHFHPGLAQPWFEQPDLSVKLLLEAVLIFNNLHNTFLLTVTLASDVCFYEAFNQ